MLLIVYIPPGSNWICGVLDVLEIKCIDGVWKLFWIIVNLQNKCQITDNICYYKPQLIDFDPVTPVDRFWFICDTLFYVIMSSWPLLPYHHGFYEFVFIMWLFFVLFYCVCSCCREPSMTFLSLTWIKISWLLHFFVWIPVCRWSDFWMQAWMSMWLLWVAKL